MSFQPKTWDDYIGQERLKEYLQIKIDGANERFTALPHILFTGVPGCGKTALASLIAQELGAPFLSYIMPVKPVVIKRFVQRFEGVVLLDEIHRMSAAQEQDLLPLLSDGYLQQDNGVRIYAGSLTIIGATTKPKKIDDALYSRFDVPSFDPYTDDEMGRIVQGMAASKGMNVPSGVAVELGRATGGVPRAAERIMAMALDLKSLDVPLILEKCRLTPDGLTEVHVKYLNVLADASAPMGINLLASYLQIPADILLDLENLLVARGFIEHTKQGRAITAEGLRAVGIKTF